MRERGRDGEGLGNKTGKQRLRRSGRERERGWGGVRENRERGERGESGEIGREESDENW